MTAAADKLLVYIAKPVIEGSNPALAQTFTPNKWKVLWIDAGALTASSIVEAIRAAGSFSEVMVVADRGMATMVCTVLLEANRDGVLGKSNGLVTLDALSENDFEANWPHLAEVKNLATIWAVNRSARALRDRTFQHHAALQAQGRETHFLVLSDEGPSLIDRLSDLRGPLGREVRWLLAPVHSRSA